MTKRNILIFMASCLALTKAVAAPIPADSTVIAPFRDYSTEQTVLSPAFYLDGVLVDSPWKGNWFIGVAGGMSAFLGNPLGCEDLFGRLRPSWAVSAGKWFTPQIGGRIGYRTGRFKDGILDTEKFQYFHVDLLWNVMGGRYKNGKPSRWGFVPYAGMGLLHHKGNGQKQFAFSYGVQAQCRLTGRLAATLELGNVTTFREFDGYGRSGRLGDHILSLSAGLSVTLGKDGWRRAVDADAYIYRNEILRRRADRLKDTNSRYASRHEKDTRVIRELRKILEVEGLLDRYGWTADSLSGNGGNPGNNYSGLNSLRARLRNRHWNGREPLVLPMDTTCNDMMTGHSMQDGSLSAVGNLAGTDTLQTGKTEKLPEKDIDIPIYFFFELGTTELTEQSQKINLDALASVITRYGLSVTVTGAADSMTGTDEINDRLGKARADYIAGQLVARGVLPDRIEKADLGGISDYNPMEGNRHTQVRLFIPR